VSAPCENRTKENVTDHRRDPLLQVSGLIKRFAGVVATDQVSLDVGHREIHALIGPNGAGKTTFVSLLAGSLTGDAGSIVFDGIELQGMTMHRRVKQGLARSYQITSLFPEQSVIEHFMLAIQARSGSSFSFWHDRGRETALMDEARLIAAKVGLEEKIAWPAGQLAHGEQRQLEVGLALATRPRLLLLDEPMAGIGPQESSRLINLIASLRLEASILLVEHDMAAVFQLADRISVLVNGAIIASGTPEEIRRDPEVRRAYLGDEHAAY
jgi:branched-chain amino acid transport system ATP-binding protein